MSASAMTDYPDVGLYIGGTWRTAADDLPVVNPANEQVIGRLARAGRQDLDDALEAAAKGFEVWSQTAPKDRADVLRRAAAIMRERHAEIAHAITLELGKPYQQAKLEVIRGCEFFEWDAGEAVRTYGRVIPSASGINYIVHHQPIGAVAAFSPWNFPMSQPARKVAGALAAGCSIILKPAEETPAGAMHIARAFHDAGLPPGVLNLVYGVPSEISEYLIPHESIRLVAFTGSTAVGRLLTGLASDHMTPVLMELGGHAPVIVCEDTDVRAAAVTSGHRRPGPRRAGPAALRGPHRAGGRGRGGDAVGGDRCGGGRSGRLLRALGRRGPDAGHRHVPGLPAPAAGGAGGRRAGSQRPQHHHRHRGLVVAVVCPAGALPRC